MKHTISVLMILLASLIMQCSADETEAEVFVKNAAQTASIEHKVLVIEFWAPSCFPCIGLKRDIFENKMQQAFVDQYFHVVKVSPADSIYTMLWDYFNLVFQSSIIYLDYNGIEVDRTVAYDGDRDAYLKVMKDISFGKNQYLDVVKNYRRDTSNVVNRFLLARKFASRYELTEAERLYRKVLIADSAHSYKFQDECLFKITEIDFIRTGALTKMQEFVDLASKNTFAPKAYVYLINNLISKKDKSGCLAMCERGFRMYPDSWEILNKYAWALYTFKVQEEYPKALSMVQKSISLNPSRAATYSTEAWIHFEMGDTQKAIQLLKKGKEIYPDRSFVKDLETFEKK